MDLNKLFYSRKREFRVSERCSGIFWGNKIKVTALMTPEILLKTFQNMDMEMLLVCRLVCKTWSKEATYWVQKLSAYIQLPLRTQSSNEEEHKNSILNMEALKKCIDQSSNWPLTKIKYLGFQEDTEKSSEVDKMVASILTSISPWITDLSFDFLEGRKLGDDVKLRRVHFTRLKSFKVEIDKTWTVVKLVEPSAPRVNADFEIRKMEDQFFYVIRSSEVEKVDITERGPERLGYVLSCVLQRLKRIGFGSITKLHITTYICNGHLYYLSQMGPKLTELSLTFLEIPEPVKSTLVKVFETFSTSLVNLKVSFQHTRGRPLVVLDFPKMEQLEYLAVNIGNNLNLQTANISYTDMFTKLKSLSLSASGSNLKFMLKPCQTLEAVEFGNQPFLTEFLAEGSTIFPHVKSMTVDVCWLRKVCQYWPYLEEIRLDVLQHDNLEFDLACVDYKTWQTLKSRYQNGDSMEIIQEEYHKRKPEKTLADLKKLKVLRLKPKSKRDSRSISELICRLIFMKMESLKCLDLCGGFHLDQNI